MDIIYRIMGVPLGWIMWACYQLISNYGLALFLFTFLIRLLLFPLTIKQQKSTAKTAMFQPQLKELQAKYKDNKEKLNEEMMKLYQKEGFNPMSGCLPTLIQFPILFGVIEVVYKPMKYILRLDSEVIELAYQIMGKISGEAVQTSGLSSVQLQIIDQVKNAVGTPAMMAWAPLGVENIEKISNINMSFLGMNLADFPKVSMFLDWNPIVLIPVLAGLSALLMSIISMRNTAATMEGAGGSMKTMMYIMPLFSVWIGFQVAAGVGLYWTYSSLVGMLQFLVTNKLYNPKEMAEKARIEHEKRKEQERQERLEAKKKLKETQQLAAKGELSEEELEKALTQKEINRRKLAAARKRDAEKYGEEYVEVTDDDLT